MLEILNMKISRVRCAFGNVAYYIISQLLVHLRPSSRFIQFIQMCSFIQFNNMHEIFSTFQHASNSFAWKICIEVIQFIKMRSNHSVPSIHQNGFNFAQNTRFIVATSFSSSSVAPPLNCTFKLQIEVHYGNVDNDDGHECPAKMMMMMNQTFSLQTSSHSRLNMAGFSSVTSIWTWMVILMRRSSNQVGQNCVFLKKSRILDSNLSASIFDQKEVLWHQREHIWPNDC